MMNVTFNEAKSGIEVRFDNKPETAVLDGLKSNGFRWSGKQHIWYAKQNNERISFVNSITDGVSSSVCNNLEKLQRIIGGRLNEYFGMLYTRSSFGKRLS